MIDYKQDIENTRKGCLGSSDAALLNSVSNLGYVHKQWKKRLAVLKGFIENENITTRAMKFGDFVEQSIFNSLHERDERYESNPCWVSKKYSKRNFKVIDHVDIVLVDEETKTLSIWEVKASKYTFEEVRQNYRPQLYHHALMAHEKAKELGGYRVKLHLAHYDTSSVDLEQPFEFDPSLITIKQIHFNTPVFNMEKATEIVDAFLDDFDLYSEDESIEARYLPAEVKQQFDGIANVLREIKERELVVDDFKRKLYDYLNEKGVKKVVCDDFSFTVVEPSTQISFDHKKYMEDFAAKYPRKAKKLREQYKKVVNKRGYVKISVKDN